MEETKYEAFPLTDMSAKNLEEIHIEEVVDSRDPDLSENNAYENLISTLREDIEETVDLREKNMDENLLNAVRASIEDDKKVRDHPFKLSVDICRLEVGRGLRNTNVCTLLFEKKDINPKGCRGGPKVPSGFSIGCHFSQNHAMVTKILDFIHICTS